MAVLSNDLIRVHGFLLLAMMAKAGFCVMTWLLPASGQPQGAAQLLRKFNHRQRHNIYTMLTMTSAENSKHQKPKWMYYQRVVGVPSSDCDVQKRVRLVGKCISDKSPRSEFYPHGSIGVMNMGCGQ
jgi:hypothetical protein